MLPVPDEFEFDYRGTDVRYGRGRVEHLGEPLAERGLHDALVVCGSNVGANDAVMDPVRRGLGDRLVGVFDETTPAKTVETVFDGVEVMREVDPDVLVGLGGGSSLDVARQMSVFAAGDRSLADLKRAAREGDVEPPAPQDPPTPVVVVPTTFAGADLSSGGSAEVFSARGSPTGQPVRTGGSLTPVAALYDPDLFETTPWRALAGSAMNGFDKGVETVYAPDATPRSDATAVRGLRFLGESLPAIADDPGDASAFDGAVVGVVLVQLDRRVSVVHAVGHGFARRYPVQQGAVHAVAVPHVLRFVLDRVDGRRAVLAEGLGLDPTRPDDDLAEGIVDAVTEVRDALGLPSRLGELDPVAEADLPAVAEFVVDDPAMGNAPRGLDADADDVERVLREAW